MDLDVSTCYRAVAARDSRFDGRFFTAVRTTGIYCRPICPARTPKPENVEFFACAAAAEEAGFRACRRCRPETSPGTPAWSGKSATVSRALRLIDGADEEMSLESIAGRLGVGTRHLRRLFRQELGASPKAVEITRRVHFARRLIEETSLPVSRIAMTAGFGSLRRFNEAIRDSFGASPVALRAERSAEKPSAPPRTLALQIAYRPPSPWRSVSRFLGVRAIPGVEAAGPGFYRRTFRAGGTAGVLEVRPAPGKDAIELRIPAVASPELLGIAERVRRLFDTDADPDSIGRHLRGDPRLAARARLGGPRLPGSWDAFETGARAILGQQVSVAAARTLAGRLAELAGDPLPQPERGLARIFPDAERVAETDVAPIGIPAARARTLRAFASAYAAGRVSAAASEGLDRLLAELLAVPGIGEWTAHYIAMRAFGEPDAFPAGDLGLRKAFGRRGRPAAGAELERISQRWRPWRAYAAVAIWEGKK